MGDYTELGRMGAALEACAQTGWLIFVALLAVALAYWFQVFWDVTRGKP